MSENKYIVYISEPAETDLKDIVSYISSVLQSPLTASEMLETIGNALSKLSSMPYIHALARDDRLASLGYRLLLIKNYIAFFTVNENEKSVNVERILYGRRDWKRIL